MPKLCPTLFSSCFLRDLTSFASTFQRLRSGRMLSGRNTRWLVVSLGVIMQLSLGGTTVVAQEAAAQPTSAVPEKVPGVGVPGVDWDDAQQVYQQIVAWIAKGDVEQVDPLQTPPMHLVSDFGGLCVTLRWMGKTFGIGHSEVAVSIQGRDKKSDLLHHARVATSEALQNLKMRLPQWGKLPADQRPILLVDLQIARCAQLIPPLPARSKVNVLSLASPDAQGLILQDTDRRTTWTWPATNLAMNLSPAGVVKGMLLELGRKPSLEISLLDEVNPMQVYRFEVIHLVQSKPQDQPVKLERGVQVLAPILEHQQIMTATWAQASHLAHRYREDGHIAASYEPTGSRYTLQDADISDQAMTAYALSNQMLLAMAQRPDWEGYAATGTAMRNGITYLLSIMNDYVIRRDPDAAAWVLMTLIQEPTLADLKTRRDELAKTLASVQQTDGHFTQRRPDANGTPVTQTVSRFDQALIHLALLKLYDQTRDETLLPILEQSGLVLEAESSKQALMAVATLFAIRDLQSKLALGLPSPVDSTTLINQTRSLLLEHQITQDPAMGPADVIGGFDLARQSASIAPAPDWRSAYGVSLLATILKDPVQRPKLAEAVGLSQTELLLRSALAARFVVQLTYTAPEVFYGDSVIDCVGGVRQSPWDNTLTLRATATSLLSLQQFNEAVMQSLK